MEFVGQVLIPLDSFVIQKRIGGAGADKAGAHRQGDAMEVADYGLGSRI